MRSVSVLFEKVLSHSPFLPTVPPHRRRRRHFSALFHRRLQTPRTLYPRMAICPSRLPALCRCDSVDGSCWTGLGVVGHYGVDGGDLVDCCLQRHGVQVGQVGTRTRNVVFARPADLKANRKSSLPTDPTASKSTKKLLSPSSPTAPSLRIHRLRSSTFVRSPLAGKDLKRAFISGFRKLLSATSSGRFRTLRCRTFGAKSSLRRRQPLVLLESWTNRLTPPYRV